MRFRTGLLIGLAVGYYYGAKAGHERFEQIEAWLDSIRRTTTYQDLRTKVSDGFRETTTAARRALETAASSELERFETSDQSLGALFSDPTLN
jgi:hypothetical protein